MSRNTKSCTNKNVRRRSALSFAGADGSLDVDHILQSDPWKNVEIFETSEVARIQNVLDDFGNMIIQDKTLKPGRTTAKKSPRTSPRTTKESTMKSPIKNSTMDLPGTSSSTSNNIETTEKKKVVKRQRKRASTTPEQTSKEETIPRELISNIDNIEKEIQKCSRANVEENVNPIKKKVKKINLSDQTYVTNLQTSTPKQELPKTIKRTAKKGKSAAKDKKPKINDSENKLKKRIKCKEEQKTLKKNVKEKQDESSVNMSGEEKKTNVKLENNLKCNEVNQNASKNKVEDETAQCCAMFSNEIKKKHTEPAEINNNIEKNVKPKEYNKNSPNESKKKNQEKKKKENSENKLPKSVKSTKSLKMSQANNAGNAKCQCKKNPAKRSDGQCLLRTKEQIEKRRQHKKSIKAARAIDELSRRITVVKKKMKCIKNDLVSNESSDSDSSYSDESSYSSGSSYSTHSSSSSSFSYDSFSDGCSCTSCSCYNTNDDYTEYTLNSCKSLISTESNGDSSESDDQTK